MNCAPISIIGQDDKGLFGELLSREIKYRVVFGGAPQYSADVR
jgi:hypothetical protein